MISHSLNRIFNRAKIDDRLVNELIGLSQGLIADGILNTQEVLFLQKWLVANSGASNNPLVAVLLKRVEEMLADGVLSADEIQELMQTLGSFAGGDYELGELTKSTTLPLCKPLPDVVFPERNFCFTGTFAFGARNDCETAVTGKGARAGALTQKTNYLVIGCYASDAWIHSTYGRKIEKACEYKSMGLKINIISEDHWLNSLRA